MKKPICTAALLMGGKGERFASNVPKQLHRLAGKRIYLHTLDAFLSSKLFDEIIIACPKQWLAIVKKECEGKAKVIVGGNTRQESSYLAVQAARSDCDIITIHDAVRPFVNYQLLKENLDLAIKHGAADTCIKATDTMVYSEDTQSIETIPDRSKYYRGQTPQTFHYHLIKHAHEKALENSVKQATDDCQLVHRLNHKIAISNGSDENMKITSPLDIYIAEQILRFRQNETFPTSSNDLKGKMFVITGGTGEIGKAICNELELLGAKTVSISTSSKDYVADLSNYQTSKQIFEKLFHHHGEVDGMINCLGYLVVKSLDNLSNEEIEKQLSANLTSIIYACKHVKIKPGGYLLNISSSSYSKGRKDYAIYSCTKAAVVNFSQALAEERSDLCVATIAPQRTKTLLREKNFPNENPNDLLKPEQLAQQIIKHLQSGYPTGSVINIRKT